MNGATRSNKPVLTERRKVIEEAKLQALNQAAKQGWVDIAAGRYTDVADDQLVWCAALFCTYVPRLMEVPVPSHTGLWLT